MLNLQGKRKLSGKLWAESMASSGLLTGPAEITLTDPAPTHPDLVLIGEVLARGGLIPGVQDCCKGKSMLTTVVPQ